MTAVSTAFAQTAEQRRPLRFGWVAGSAAVVELTSERRIGSLRQSTVVRMRLRVLPDTPAGGLVVELSHPEILAAEGTPLDAARVLGRITPSFAVDASGRFAGDREADRMVREVLAAAGFPAPPMGAEAFADLVRQVAPSDWQAWVELWIGDAMIPGEWTRTDRVALFEGAIVPAKRIRRRLEPSGSGGSSHLLEVEYPSEGVRHYTVGVLLDLAVEAKRLGDDVRSNRNWIRGARFSPVTETITAELEDATMRPRVVTRERSFFAENDGFRVEGRERRVHRFSWIEAARAIP